MIRLTSRQAKQLLKFRDAASSPFGSLRLFSPVSGVRDGAIVECVGAREKSNATDKPVIEGFSKSCLEKKLLCVHRLDFGRFLCLFCLFLLAVDCVGVLKG